MNIIIRNVKMEDIPSVVDIKINGWKSAYRGIISDNYFDNMDRDKLISKMFSNYDSNGFIVAIFNSQIVGFCRYIYSDVDSSDCELSALYVRPDMKGMGIGTKLFNYVLEEFRNCGKSKMILWCLKDNFNSINFYSNKGGMIISDKSFNLDGILYTDVCFEFDLKG